MCELFLSCSTFTANSLALLELIPFSPNKMCGFKDGGFYFGQGSRMKSRVCAKETKTVKLAKFKATIDKQQVKFSCLC